MKIKLKKTFCLLLMLSTIFLNGCVLAFILPAWDDDIVHFEYWHTSDEERPYDNWLNVYVECKKKVTMYVDNNDDGYKILPISYGAIDISNEFDINNMELDISYGVCSKYFNTNEKDIVNDIVLNGVTYKFKSLCIYVYNLEPFKLIRSQLANNKLDEEYVNECYNNVTHKFATLQPVDNYLNIPGLKLMKEITISDILEHPTHYVVPPTTRGYGSKPIMKNYTKETLKIQKEILEYKRNDGSYECGMFSIIGYAIFYSEETGNYIGSYNLCETDEDLYINKYEENLENFNMIIYNNKLFCEEVCPITYLYTSEEKLVLVNPHSTTM